MAGWLDTALVGSVEPTLMQTLPLAELAQAVVQQGDDWRLQGDLLLAAALQR